MPKEEVQESKIALYQHNLLQDVPMLMYKEKQLEHAKNTEPTDKQLLKMAQSYMDGLSPQERIQVVAE